MKEQAFRADAREAKGLHDGSITRVVRVVDPQPTMPGEIDTAAHDNSTPPEWWVWQGRGDDAEPMERLSDCPFGVVGDRLFVQEEWCKGEYWTEEGELWYRARPEDEQCFNEGEGSACDSGWHAAGTMPPYASRTLLDVTDVRVVRAQEVTGQDMRAAGMTFGCRWCTAPGACAVREVCEHPRDEFRELVGRAVFDANRWLWLATAQKVES